MTLSEMKISDKTMLVPTDVSEVLGVHHHSINLQAKEDASKLGFRVSVIGTRVLIPRVAFIKWLEGESV